MSYNIILIIHRIIHRIIRRIIRRIDWARGTKYEMYRHDYSIYNLSPITNSPSLYDADYYVINGGTIGLEERTAHWEKAKSVLGA